MRVMTWLWVVFGFVMGCGLSPQPVEIEMDTGVSWVGAEAEGGVPAWWPLHLYWTCGDPVCTGYTPSTLPTCIRDEGDPCRAPGKSCDPGPDPCNRRLTCTNEDPTLQGCPISRAEFKRDIQYVDDQVAQQVHSDLMDFRLATWAYTHEGVGGQEHFGFIIDDVEPSPSVAAGGDHVDLYGYTSMAVAALQVQARQIEALQKQVERLEARLSASEGVSNDLIP